MIDITKKEAVELVQNLHDSKQDWHYHLLTPTCQFNKSSKHAILIENVGENKQYVLHTDVAEMELSNKFSSLLHGAEVMDKKNTKLSYIPTKEVKEILNLINKLTEDGLKWHHHVFFPGCTFNSHPGKFELIIEDPKSDRRLMSVTDTEPTEDLKQIESVFYSQSL